MSSDRLDSEKSEGDVGDKPSQPEMVEVEGRVTLGLVQNAEVYAYAFTRPSPAQSLPLSSAKTDNSGRFNLTISPEYLGLPIYLEVVGLEGQSTIICPVAAGCSGYGFGEAVPLSGDFRLSLAAPTLTRNSRFNVSLLTHIAAQWVQHAAGEDASSSDVSDSTRFQLKVSQANSRVASRLGVIGDLIHLNTVDLTSFDEIANANDRELWYALMGPGVWRAYDAIGAGDWDIHNVVYLITDLYIKNGLKNHIEESTHEIFISYEQILDGARDTLVHIQGESGVKDVSKLLTELNTAIGLAKSSPSNDLDQGSRSRTGFLSSYEKALALIDDITQVTASVNLPRLISLANISSLVDPKAAAAIDQFGFEISAAELFEGNRSNILTGALMDMVQVTFEAFILAISNEPLPESINGISFQHEYFFLPNEPNLSFAHQFTFEQLFFGCESREPSCQLSPDITITIRSTGVNANKTENFIAFLPLDLKVDGSLSVDGLELTFDPLRQQILFETAVITDMSTQSDDLSYRLQADQSQVNIPFEMSYIGDDTDGNLSVKAALEWTTDSIDIKLESIKTENVVSSGQVQVSANSRVEVAELAKLNGTLNMLVENVETGKNFVAALGLTQSKPHSGAPISYESLTVHLCPEFGIDDMELCTEEYEDSGLQGETEDHFLALSASIGFKANLRGLATPVNLEIFGTREEPEVNRIDTMKLRYPGQAVALKGTFRSGKVKNKAYMESLDAVSLDGTRIIIESDAGGERYGSIVNSLDEIIADITDEGEWLNVRFDNGFFQSFCQC